MTRLLGAQTDVLDRVSESFSADAQRMQDIRALAARALAELEASWSGPGLIQLRQQWEQQASPSLAGATASLDTCAAQLRAQSAAQRTASSDEASGAGLPTHGLAPVGALGVLLLPGPAGNQPAHPPKNGSPDANAAWWRALSPPQQQQVITEHPEWVGSRDGVSFAARDQANRVLLTTDRSALVTQRQRLEADRADGSTGVARTRNDADWGRVMDELASLDAIEKTLGRTGDRQLLLLDLSAERAQAAIARGDVDTADNVAVFVPGLSANVSDSMLSSDNAMDQLQRRTELESRRANANQSAATVTWIGYQAPQMGWDLIGENSVADDQAARNGAEKLVPFLRGIGAARSDDAHLTLLGHSYGSTTAGLALRQNTGVDDVVFFGSPGLGTSHVRDLLLPAGHVYYIEARQDAVGDLGYFGIDPSHLAGVEHASARESTIVDPMTGETRHLKESTGHSSYLSDNSTSQYNMSVLVAGVADRRVHDAGEGVGDLLSWPIPGTYR